MLPEEKVCTKCGGEKPIEDFRLIISHGKQRRQSFCRKCDRFRRRAQKLRKRYNITLEDYEELLYKQGGVCAICKKDKSLRVDHNHKTNMVRGLLCPGCNVSIGFLEENITIINNTVKYLKSC